MFNVGDRVVCSRPANENMERHRWKEATVVGVKEGKYIALSIPFPEDWIYTPEQFDLVEAVEENE